MIPSNMFTIPMWSLPCLNFKKKKPQLEKLVKSFPEKKGIQINDIWSVSYKKGDYHTPHDHGSVGLAGILYLNMPKNAPVTQYIQPWNDWQSDRTIYRPIPVIEGTIVVTPKFIRHFTEPSKESKLKRVISWDMSLF